MSALRRRLMQMHRSKAEYIKINYLQSSGKQYINTEVVPFKDLRIEMEYATVQIRNPSFIISSRKAWKSQDITLRTNGTVSYGDVELSIASAIAETDIRMRYYIADYGTDKVKCGIAEKETGVTRNEILGTPYEFTSDYPIYLFGCNNAGSFSFGSYAKIYSVKMYDSGRAIRDMIPVLDADEIPAFYDRVEGKFYYNQGTGDFIYG